jgi:hypothetical protein
MKDFIAYDYKEIVADSGKVSFLLDGYENFGWKPDENTVVNADAKKVVLHMKRNRKIVNKAELTRLQRNFEACVREIDVLEGAKTSKATSLALIIGVVGTAFMAGSVFAVTAEMPQILLCIILAIPGFAGWILPYFVYRKVNAEQAEKMDNLIEKKYDEIYEICEKGNRLLNG